MAPNKQFNILIVGSTGVGKTTYINRLRTGDLSSIESKGVPSVTFNTSSGKVKMNMYESNLVEGMKYPVHGAIIMYDVLSKLSYNVVETLHANLRDRYGATIPIVLCGNKVDRGLVVKHRSHPHMVHFNLSVMSNYNFERPFVHLIQTLVGPATVIV